jgi:hypothetical protein
MTKNEIWREPWWVRLGYAMGPGLYALRLLAPGPRQHQALLAVYRSIDRRARRGLGEAAR